LLNGILLIGVSCEDGSLELFVSALFLGKVWGGGSRMGSEATDIHPIGMEGVIGRRLAEWGGAVLGLLVLIGSEMDWEWRGGSSSMVPESICKLNNWRSVNKGPCGLGLWS
jgi:hypothetical protein